MDKDKSAHNNLKKKKKKNYSNKIKGSLENSSTKIRHNNRTMREREREREHNNRTMRARERERERGGGRSDQRRK